MQWYFVDGAQRRGPITQAEIIQLFQAGTITNSTLVWNSTLANWIPAAKTALPAEAKATPAKIPCIVTGNAFPESEMIRTEHGWVSAEGKDAYYQALREGIAPTLAPNLMSARRDGKRIVVPISDPRLPARCVKTNRMVSASEIRSKKLYWVHPAVYLAILLNLIILLVLTLDLRKKLLIDIPLSTEARGRIRTNAAIAAAGVLAGIALVVAAIIESDTGQIAWMLPAGLALIVGALIFASRKATALRVSRMRGGNAWLAGASPAFLESLPPYSA